jgi:methionyl aminopeptidase
MSYIKTPQEIQKIIEGGKLMGEVLEKLEPMVAEGVSGFEIDAEAERLIRAAGAVPAFKGYKTRKQDPPYPGTLCFSLNDEVVHGIPTKEKIIKKGDLVSLDIGMKWPAKDGYFTDTALTVAVGKVPVRVRNLIAVTREALEIGIEEVRIGNTIADIGRAIEKYVKKQGKYGIVEDLVGHGVGHAVHEEPRVPNYDDKELEQWEIVPGVVIAIEPMITLGTYKVVMAADGWSISTADRSLSAHFEHTIAVTEKGAVVVTRRPSEKI